MAKSPREPDRAYSAALNTGTASGLCNLGQVHLVPVARGLQQRRRLFEQAVDGRGRHHQPGRARCVLLIAGGPLRFGDEPPPDAPEAGADGVAQLLTPIRSGCPLASVAVKREYVAITLRWAAMTG